MGTIQISQALLTYVDRFSAMSGEILSMQRICDQAKQTLEQGYDGKAKEDLLLYYTSLSMHLEKLATLHSMAAEYCLHTFEKHEHNDEVMAQWFASKV